jgi:hypothetical protein
LNGVIEFETISAAILELFIILKLIKVIVDIVIHGYQLHETYGYRITLLGAICGSVTNLLLYMKRRRNTEDQTSNHKEYQSHRPVQWTNNQQHLHPL